MKAVFIESSEFNKWATEYLTDELIAALQRELLADPGKGTPMPGCGGLRKIRTPDPLRGKGERGGIRVNYLHVPEANVIFLMDIYHKGEKEDLSAAEKRFLKALAEQYKHEAIRLTQKE